MLLASCSWDSFPVSVPCFSSLKLSLAREQEVVVARDVDLAASRQRIRGLLAEAGRGAAAAGLGSGAGASQGAGPLASASGAPKRPLSMS
eukprot:825632-Pelagomonas_calceolata.AAC.1